MFPGLYFSKYFTFFQTSLILASGQPVAYVCTFQRLSAGFYLLGWTFPLPLATLSPPPSSTFPFLSFSSSYPCVENSAVIFKPSWISLPAWSYPRHIQINAKVCMPAQSRSCVQLFCDPVDCSWPGFSIHRISQARILGNGLPFLSPGYLRNQGSNLYLPLGRWILYHCVTWEACAKIGNSFKGKKKGQKRE